jgi:hypothetical protein
MANQTTSNPESTPTGPAATPATGTPGGAAAAAAPATIPTAGTMPAALPVAVKVSFTLNTPDHLRQISFGLEKDTDGVKVNWTITFTLFERTDKDQEFGDPLVSLNVFVAAALHANAEKAAHGLTPAQAAHVTGPAADAAKGVHEGTIPLAVGNKVIQNSVK